MSKYRCCCSTACLLSHCEVRDNGGCYCACRCVDHMNMLKSIIEDKGAIKYGFIYLPSHEFQNYLSKLTDEQKKEREKEKIKAREELIEVQKIFDSRWNGELISELPNESHNSDKQPSDDAKTDCNHDFSPKKTDLKEKGV